MKKLQQPALRTITIWVCGFCIILIDWLLFMRYPDHLVLGFRGQELSRMLIGGYVVLFGALALWRKARRILQRMACVGLILGGISFMGFGLQRRLALPFRVIECISWGAISITVVVCMMAAVTAWRRSHNQ